MALLKFGGGITEMRGSIAGNVYSRNRYGAYARARTKPVNPNTSMQQTIRNTMSTLRSLWFNTLTAAQRVAWATYAANVNMTNKLGESILLSGYNHFCRSNAARLYNGVAHVAAGPTTFSLPDIDSALAVSGTADDQKIATVFTPTDPWALEVGAYMFLYMGIPQDATINFFNGPWKRIGYVVGQDPADTSPIEIDSPYPIAADQKFWVRARISRADGRLTEYFRDDGVVAAS